MRALIALLALLVLTGCGEGESMAPLTDSRLPPGLEQRFLPPQGWAWGLIKVGSDPAVRYGVAGPATAARGDVLVLCGYGESAEAWFETAADLIGRGYVVWIMDGAGQGGSARFTRPRDMGHSQGGDPDADALAAMTAVIGRPAAVLAQSTAAPVALAAAGRGLAVRTIILSAPSLRSADPPVRAAPSRWSADALARLRLGWMRAEGQRPWTRGPARRGRPGVIDHWQAANPDLRMGGASWGWVAAFDRRAKALTPDRLSHVAAPVTIIAGPRSAGAAADLCRRMRRCALRPLVSGSNLHLEGDLVYRPWLSAVDDALAAAFPPL